MINEKEIAHNLIILIVIKSRLNTIHRYIEQQLQNVRAGQSGELSLNYFLQLLEHDFLIIPNIEIKLGNTTFQIDRLIITTKFLLIIEIKNHTGTIEFKPEIGQMIQTIRNERKPYEYPISQAETQALKLQAFLNQHGITVPPIETFVVFTNKNVILESGTEEPIDERIMTAYALRNKINQLFLKYKNRPDVIDQEKIIQLINQHRAPFSNKYIKKLGLTPKDFATGVKCPNCQARPMKRIWGTWQCQICGHENKEAHINALKDFYIIFGSLITTRQAQYWLQLTSESVARKLLTNLQCRKMNGNKNRLYELPFKFPTDFIEIVKSDPVFQKY
ncbi:nuclease-related domain-containing protein [Bacillaceae bacterium W0354]